MESVTFSSGLWAESLRVLRLNMKNLGIYICFMLAIAILPELLTKDGEIGGLWIAQFIAAAMLAIPAHLTVLRNIAVFDATANKAMWGFVWRSIAIGVGSFVPCFLLMIALIGLLDWGVILSTLVVMAVWPFVGSAAYAKWGTILPAVITDHPKSISAAANRGNQTFGYAFPRLLISFGLIAVVALIAPIGIAMLSTGDGNFFPKSGGIDLIMLVALIAGILIGGFGLVMTAVILSRAFLMAEGKTTLE